MIELTREQQELATENHNLIYGFLNKNNLSVDDWYDIIAIGYCKAITSYNDSKKVALSTYAYQCMRNVWANTLRKTAQSSTVPDCMVSSLETPIKTKGKQFSYCDTTLGDVLIAPSTYELTVLQIARIRNRLSGIHRVIFDYSVAGYSQREIGRLMGRTQQWVSHNFKTIRSIVSEEMW